MVQRLKAVDALSSADARGLRKQPSNGEVQHLFSCMQLPNGGAHGGGGGGNGRSHPFSLLQPRHSVCSHVHSLHQVEHDAIAAPMPRRREALGRPTPSAVLGSALAWSGCNYGPHVGQTLTLRVAHVQLHMCACNHGACTVHSHTAVTVDLPSNLSSIGWGFVLRVFGRARRAGCALR